MLKLRASNGGARRNQKRLMLAAVPNERKMFAAPPRTDDCLSQPGSSCVSGSTVCGKTLKLSSRRRRLPKGSAFSLTFARKADLCLRQAGLAALGMTPLALFPQTVKPHSLCYVCVVTKATTYKDPTAAPRVAH